MPGTWIKPQQVERYMNARRKGYSQKVASIKAGFSERRGRDIEHQRRLDPTLQDHHRRTRPDPLITVWEEDLKPLLTQTPSLMPMTLLEYLQDKYPGRYPDGILRTLQRRVKQWRAVEGPDKEVMFRQTQEIGRQGLSDFTSLKNVRITIAEKTFVHRLYHFRLSYSRWSFIKVVQGGESFPALTQGLQEALKKLGGCPKEHRTDSLSAAFKNISQKSKEDMTSRYETFCRHYGMVATRNNRGKGHENGSIESSHGHIKRRIVQALLLRGNNHFERISDYQQFIDEVVDRSNQRNAHPIHIEKKALLPLPIRNAMDYIPVSVIVSSSSTIAVRRVIYTVPSRLQGEVLTVRLYDDQLVCYLGTHHVVTLKRIHLCGKNRRGRDRLITTMSFILSSKSHKLFVIHS